MQHPTAPPTLGPLDDLKGRLADVGWVLLPGVGQAGRDAACAALDAEVLLETDVRVRPGRALVTSDRALGFHTDHHRADLIAWLCVAQTSQGGGTRLADGLAALASLPTAQQELLARVRLFEHSVFPGDGDTHPVVEPTPAGPRLYCSFWFDAPLDPEAEAALEAFRVAVIRHEVARFYLAPDDVLFIDNRRILHARTAIVGSRDRHLIRHWLKMKGC
ncbi:MAG: hypothetical protein EP329_01050 [Deltaproteobacteria bacterium]|nr:MAG: hypothetical protein EP329_01050 [Deltaproteobacteria bacterium]